MFIYDMLHPYILVRPNTPGAPKCVALFIFYFSFFYRTLSGGEPTELMMQQPGKDKGCDEHLGGLHYEH